MQYTLKNEFLEATFESFGAEVISLKDDEGKEYLWCGDSKFWGRHAPVLFPFVGKVRDGKYNYKDVTYSISQHGFARDMEFAFVSQTEDEIWFVLESTEETMLKYPFAFRLEIGYKLIENTLRILWKVINPAEETMYFSIGSHPAFLCPLDEGTKQSEYFLQVKGGKTLEYYCASLLNGLRLPEKHVLELKDERCQLVDGFFDMEGERGTYIFEDSQLSEVSLVRPDGRPYVTLSFDMPVAAFWSPEKKQAPFVCIEPWCGRGDKIDFAGSLEEREWGQALEAGGVFTQGYDIRIDK